MTDELKVGSISFGPTNPRMIWPWDLQKPGPWGAVAPPHLKLPATARAELLHNEEGLKGRRVIPIGSGAVACWGSDWAHIIELLANPIADVCPYVMHRSTTWILRARFDGNSTTFAEHGLVATPEFQDKLSPCRATWGADWTKLMDLLHLEIKKSIPEIRTAPFVIPRARRNGIRIEFFDRESAMLTRIVDVSADLLEGRAIENTGRIWIEFFDDDGRLPDRLLGTVAELAENAQVHGGRLDWI